MREREGERENESERESNFSPSASGISASTEAMASAPFVQMRAIETAREKHSQQEREGGTERGWE